MPIQLQAFDAHERVREAAFALLLTDHRPVSVSELGAAAGGDIDAILETLDASGWIDRAEDGRITGSAGLSLSHGPHRLTIGERSYRTWCAYDALGIPAALGTSARVETTCGECGKSISLNIVDGLASREGPELLWLAAGTGDLRTTFCTPTVLVCGRDHGRAWAAKQENDGDLLTIREASERGSVSWASPAAAALRLRSDVEFVGGPRDAERDRLLGTPESIRRLGGVYVRSVRCADDGALRYMWQEGS